MRPVADVRASGRPENNVWLAIAGLTPPEWVADALCSETDPESFFPEKGGSTREAKRICGRCTISDTTTKIAILKHLSSGKDLVQTAAFTRCTVEHARQVANAHGFPDPDKMRWAIDHLTESASASDLTSKSRVEVPAPRVSPGMSSHTPATVTPMTRPDEVRVLLNTAKAHPSKRVQNAADRVFDGIDNLKRLIAEDEEKHAERRKAEAQKAAARAEVERLEAQLREAKAKLGKKQGNKVSRPTAPKGEYPCGNEGCAAVYDTPQGRSLHERQHCQHRPEAASA